jgi:hypothetical protein
VAQDGTVGPYAARSHRVIPVESLPLATEAVREIAPLHEKVSGAETVDVLAPTSGGARLIVGTQTPSVVRERVGEREFRVDDSGFWQVHEAAALTLTRVVQDAIDPALFDPRAANLDLYGGVGLLAAAVGDRFGSAVRIITVESDARATEHAAENLADWIGAAAVTARSSAGCARWPTPRQGSAPVSVPQPSCSILLEPVRAGRCSTPWRRSALLSSSMSHAIRSPSPAMRAPSQASAIGSTAFAPSICSRTPITSRPWGPSFGCESFGVPGELTRYDGGRAFRRPHSRGRQDERG